jgi:hypothetical protein
MTGEAKEAARDERSEPLTEFEFRQLVRMLEKGWAQQCKGHRSPATCWACNAWEQILIAVRRELAPRPPGDTPE